MFSALLAGKVSAQETKKTVITINANEKVGDISPQFYGLMTEEINYSYDGGLYGELIRNRAFKDNANVPEHWSLVKEGNADGQIALDSIEQKGTELTKNLRLDITNADSKGSVGIENDGFWGIPVLADTKYTASFYAKTNTEFKGVLTVAIESNDGKTVFASAVANNVSGDWKKYTVTLATKKSTDTTSNGRFVITAKNKGTVWFSLVSLFPPTYNNRANGNRKDIMKLLADMHPGFLRFPGGNYLQSNTIENRFDWKKTLGDISQRPTHNNDSWRYHSSDGMGLMEFLGWCEDLKMQPLLAVFDGLTLNRKAQPITGDSLNIYVQDALDEIEFVIGPATTKWGALRAKLGHPNPYNLHYVEIGNEDFLDRKKTSDLRIPPFYKAIKEKYPDLEIIASGHIISKIDMEDQHFYFPFKKAFKLAHQYDDYKRTDPPVFVGEYACREGFPTTNMLGALGDAMLLTGLERNADIVKMSCFAPLFVNVNQGAMQWKGDLIGYNSLSSYGSPSYYIQKMFYSNIGNESVKSSISNVPMGADTTEQLFYSVTKDSKTGTLFLRVVNVSETNQSPTIDINSDKQVISEGKETVLTAVKVTDTNSLDNPENVKPVTSVVKGLGSHFTYTFKPHSVTVLKIIAK
jgi:alpha-N-arabinofuranosidase